ncbi:MAG: hypothetical protein WBX27_11100 [Specibacter sp.]
MTDWRESLHVWGSAWATVRDLPATADDGQVTIAGDPAEVLLAWPGPDADAPAPATGAVVHLVTADPAGARAFAASYGLTETAALVLLTAQTDDLDLVPKLPADAFIAEAPMENYDAVEVALFDRPVASGRIRLEDGLAVLAGLSVDDGHDELLGTFEHAMVAELGEEAFLHGADTLFLVADTAQGARFAAVEGWTKAADILSFTR